MFIQTEKTPNPNSLRFIPGCEVTGGASVDIKSADEANSKSELAANIFSIDGVIGVMLGHNFISVTKSETVNWDIIKPEILSVIMDCFTNGIKILNDENKICEENNHKYDVEYSEDDIEIVEQIKELLDTHVRPAVARDGGDIIFHSYSKGIVYLEMQGACSGCPSASITLKNGVKNVLQHFIPEVVDIKAV